MRKAMAGLMAIGAALAVSTAAATSAQATGKNGSVESGEVGLYYVGGSSGRVFDLVVGDGDFRNDRYVGTSISPDNNTMSYRNRDSFWWHMYTGYSFSGSHGCIPAGYVGNTSSTFTNTISSATYSSSGC